MTLEEFINQKEPVQQPIGSVVLTKGEYEIGIVLANMTNIYVPEFDYYYIMLEGSNVLWTQDQDGNPKNRSVFSISK